MKAWKNKLALGFMIVVLILSLTLGAAVWYFGNAYEKTALVYVKSLDWVVPLSALDRSTETDETSEPYVETRDRVGWKTYKGREIHNIYAVDEDSYAVSFKGKTANEPVTGYMLFDQNMNPLLGKQMFEVILEASDGMRYFIRSGKDFDGKTTKRECGFLESSGEVAFTFDHVPLCVNSFSEGLAIVYDDKLYGYNKEGKEVFALDYTGKEITPMQRENHEEDTTYTPYYTHFADGLAPVTLDGDKMGYINQKGKMVIEPVFKKAGLVEDGTATVCLIRSDSPSTLIKDHWGVLDLKGVQ